MVYAHAVLKPLVPLSNIHATTALNAKKHRPRYASSRIRLKLGLFRFLRRVSGSIYWLDETDDICKMRMNGWDRMGWLSRRGTRKGRLSVGRIAKERRAAHTKGQHMLQLFCFLTEFRLNLFPSSCCVSGLFSLVSLFAPLLSIARHLALPSFWVTTSTIIIFFFFQIKSYPNLNLFFLLISQWIFGPILGLKFNFLSIANRSWSSEFNRVEEKNRLITCFLSAAWQHQF